jgi:putative ABC transport system permease protein
VTSDFFTVLGIKPAIGRAFIPADTQQGAPKVVMITQSVWQKRFGASPDIIGKSLALGGQNYTIIGVLPASFQFAPANLADIWVPLFPDQNQSIHRYYHWLNVIARVKPGVSLEQARTAMNVMAQQLVSEHPDTWLDGGIRVISLREQIVGNIQKILLVMAGTAGFVLLIGCANLANLSLARAITRHKEIALRMALGAKRVRVLQQLLTESVVLSLLGGGLGLLWAQWGVRLILRCIPPAILVSAPYFRDVTLHTGELLFTLGLSVFTGIAFGLVPALRASRSDLQSTLKEGGRTSAGSAHQKTRDWLIVSEVALSLVLLIGAGLMTRSLIFLLHSDPGFDPKNLTTFQVSMPSVKYAQAPQIAAMQQQLLQKIQN